MQAEKGDLNSMQITDVRVRKVTKEGKLKAVVSITIDNEFVVHDIKVIEGEKACLSQCRAKKLWMGNIAISHIRSIPVQEKKIQNTILDRYQESLEADTEESGGNVRRGK